MRGSSIRRAMPAGRGPFRVRTARLTMRSASPSTSSRRSIRSSTSGASASKAGVAAAGGPGSVNTAAAVAGSKARTISSATVRPGPGAPSAARTIRRPPFPPLPFPPLPSPGAPIAASVTGTSAARGAERRTMARVDRPGARARAAPATCRAATPLICDPIASSTVSPRRSAPAALAHTTVRAAMDASPPSTRTGRAAANGSRTASSTARSMNG